MHAFISFIVFKVPIIAQSLKHHSVEDAFDTYYVCCILTTMSGSNFNLDIYCS